MDLKQQLTKSAMDSCRHFTGIQNKVCRAGIEYQEWDKVTNLAMPCIPRHVNWRATWACGLFEIMSIEDAEKEADDAIVRMQLTTKARCAAKDDAKLKGFGQGSGGSGSVTCPSCEDGKLRYRVASYNGHMHATCSTEGCVSWME